MRLKIVPDNTKIDFIGYHKLAIGFSIILVVVSLGLFAVRGLNLGIDFLGGIMLEVKTEGPADIGTFRSDLGSLGLGDVGIQEFGEPDVLLIRVQRQPGGDEAQQAAIKTITETLGDRVVEYRRNEVVGPTVGAELQEAALIAVLAAIGAILVYIWFRFEWQYGVGAVIALSHDVIATIGLFALFQLEFNLSTVAAILTIAGYSINDTVVVYDRVRDKLRRFKKLPFEELFNLAINKTLSRTVMTSFTTLLALLALLFFGGEVIRDFVIAMIWGIVIGTYSSIAIAVPLLLYMRPRRGDEDEAPTGEDATSKGTAPEAG
ncbi:protein translocase subunit SecF [Hwanghaeella grinnelliae]|uniref:Protein-export membrane protein SecF n=1 Tax=Hwanghaeella grinnelliae TaxID=2500179 RepID=A0A437QXS3_9PROT|nr:protein translocase subunit SecF [Hwanghaeella grinnelliae]RVU39243.1 protein translocase subunit SecF [Hwanghaeella grinnelliae]